ncbi:MAG: SDR family NAD(P)-dependent oxidoreductase [Sandaracinaceae bacterium]
MADEERVALVTGASRGVGKGVALALGARGWTVYVTGRTLRSIDGPSLEATVAEIEARGGHAIACECDHADDAQVRAVFDRIQTERGRLDLLVNNVFAIPKEPIWGKPFWEQPLAHWDLMHTIGLRSHFVASVYAAPWLLKAPRGLIVNISSFAGGSYQLNVAYGVGKAGVDRLAHDMAVELEPHGVAAVSLWPGIVRTEYVLSLDRPPFPMGVTESPELTGRAVVALADDPDVLSRTGEALVVAELAERYGFVDVDGTRPRSLRRRREGA